MSVAYVRVRFLALVFVAASGCGTAFHVQEAPPPAAAPGAVAEVPGIPFYAKRPRRRQETEYRRTTLAVDATIRRVRPAPSPAPAKLDRRTVADTKENRAALVALAAKRFATDPKADVERLFDGLAKEAFGADPACCANRVVVDSVVDTDRIYYLNAKVPFIGSASASFELAADQTLTKGSASVEDQTAATIFDLLPIKEALSAGLGLASESVDDEKWVVEIAVETAVVQGYRMRRALDVDSALPAPIPWSAWLQPGVESELVSAAGSESTKDAIKVSGTVTLPKG